MPTTLLPVISMAALVSAGIAVAGHYLHPPRRLLIGIFKPLSTILILAVALLPGTFLAGPYARLIVAGLVFSLIGDILLVLPDRFIHGLGAFLLAHLAYIAAFHSGAAAAVFPLVLLLLAAVGAAMLRYLWGGLDHGLKAPVAVYVIMIELMAALAIGRFFEQPSTPALLAAVGAVLFVCSDAMLAVNRFRRPFRWSEFAVLATYFAAQLLIALSV